MPETQYFEDNQAVWNFPQENPDKTVIMPVSPTQGAMFINADGIMYIHSTDEGETKAGIHKSNIELQTELIVEDLDELVTDDDMKAITDHAQQLVDEGYETPFIA